MGGNTVEDIDKGVKEILKQLEAKLPNTTIILLGVLPRAEPLGAKAKELNKLLAQFDNNKTVHFFDMWSAYESENGTQKTELYVADKLHLNGAGYVVWQKALEPLLEKLDPAVGGSHPWIGESRDGDANWMKKHENLLKQTADHGKEEQIIFIGDSITEGWIGGGKAVWDKYYPPLHAYNYGISGDRTEHVIWRIENKEFDGMNPKVAVIMIGIHLSMNKMKNN